MAPENQYLLIIACSQRKRADKGLLPAIDRYDGGNYRVLRKVKREGLWSDSIDVLVLSAKYGLIDASTVIDNYEQRMDRSRAVELKEQVTQTLENYSSRKAYSEVYLELGKDYHLAVDRMQDIFPVSKLLFSQGRIGERLRNLRCWLIEKSGNTKAASSG
jgi:hypothetical protein